MPEGRKNNLKRKCRKIIFYYFLCENRNKYRYCLIKQIIQSALLASCVCNINCKLRCANIYLLVVKIIENINVYDTAADQLFGQIYY